MGGREREEEKGKGGKGGEERKPAGGSREREGSLTKTHTQTAFSQPKAIVFPD